MPTQETIVKDPAEMTPAEVERELDLLQRNGGPGDMGRIMQLLRHKIDSRGSTLAAAANRPLADPRRTTPL